MLWRPSKRCNVCLPNACSPHINQDVTFKIFSNPLSICSHTCFLRENFKDAVVMSLGENIFFSLESRFLFSYMAACYYGNHLLVAPCYPFSMTPMENSFRKVDYTCSKPLQGVWMCPFFFKVGRLCLHFWRVIEFPSKKIKIKNHANLEKKNEK